MPRLVLLAACLFLVFPRGAEAQGMFEITPDTLFADESGQGEAVIQNASSEAVVLDSMTMRWGDPNAAVHVWEIVAVGQPTSGNEEYYTFHNVFDTQPVDLSFAVEDTLLLSFSLDPCGVCLQSQNGFPQVDSLVFHSNGLVANDTLIIDWANLVADEEGPERNSGLDLAINPNPASGLAQVTLNLNQTENVSITIYDIRGRRTAILNRGELSPGTHTFLWDSSGCSPGVYLIRAQTRDTITSKTVTVSY